MSEFIYGIGLIVWFILIFSYKDDFVNATIIKKKWGYVMQILIGISITIVTVFTIYYDGRKDVENAYIEALKGNNPYKMEFKYKRIDSTFIPVDTLYIHIK